MQYQPIAKNKLNNCFGSHRCAAFTILELIVVMAVTAILSTYAVSKFSSSRQYTQDTVAQQLIATARLAQELSMNDSGRSFSLTTTSNTVDLKADGVSLSLAGYNYPLTFDQDIFISPAADIAFSSLGETNPLTLTVSSDSSVSVCFEASGYIHQC